MFVHAIDSFDRFGKFVLLAACYALFIMYNKTGKNNIFLRYFKIILINDSNT